MDFVTIIISLHISLSRKQHTPKIDIYFYYLPEQQSKTTKTTTQFNNQAAYIYIP
jgi:hypothetical protein